MLYGVANEPLNLTATPLPPVQARFVLIFENFYTKPCLVPAKKLPQTCPEPLNVCPGPLKTCPGLDLNKKGNSGICPGPLPDLVRSIVTLLNKFGDGLSNERFCRPDIRWRCSWVWPSKHDECMDSKIYSESFTGNILPAKYLYGHISAKYSL